MLIVLPNVFTRVTAICQVSGLPRHDMDAMVFQERGMAFFVDSAVPHPCFDRDARSIFPPITVTESILACQRNFHKLATTTGHYETSLAWKVLLNSTKYRECFNAFFFRLRAI